jgi:hypothetical protein
MKTSPPSWNPLARWPWLWFVAAFATLLAAWTAFFIIAARHPTPEVTKDNIPATHSTR